METFCSVTMSFIIGVFAQTAGYDTGIVTIVNSEYVLVTVKGLCCFLQPQQSE
jgi:hypothetical protein